MFFSYQLYVFNYDKDVIVSYIVFAAILGFYMKNLQISLCFLLSIGRSDEPYLSSKSFL